MPYLHAYVIMKHNTEKNMRLTTFCAAFLSSGLFLLMSCSSIPNPLEEREPWEHAFAQAKRAAQREAEYTVRAEKAQGDQDKRKRRIDVGGAAGIGGSEDYSSFIANALRWNREKMRWLAEARQKGFTGGDDAADPEWFKKWKLQYEEDEKTAE